MAGKSGKSGKRDVKKSGVADGYSAYFKAAHIKRVFKDATGLRISKDATKMGCTAVTTFLREVIECSQRAVLSDKKKKITPRHINLAIKNDQELNFVLKNVIIQSGGMGAPTAAMLKKSKETK
ncbi:H2A [Hepatospora eriocheir]|uniref:H2A n=1 Tax=Hepatospora eriocheir TaxID=1081669 RepID=A0A1X0QCI2_9MICR|nr:H2A [Hepatospora eriocheir]ORD99026.1 H2A [Hepatospora eriocheir]